MHALDRLPPIRFSETVVVLGAGPVGLGAAAAAQASAASQTVLVGAPAARLAATDTWGLTERIDIESTTPEARIERVRELTAGRGADLILECAGPPSAFTEGFEMVRKGGTMMVVGQAHAERVPVDTTALKVRQLHINSSLSADISHYHSALRFLERHAERLDLERSIVSSAYSLDQLADALTAMRSGAEMKPVIDPRMT